jgi:hypothetical protein
MAVSTRQIGEIPNRCVQNMTEYLQNTCYPSIDRAARHNRTEDRSVVSLHNPQDLMSARPNFTPPRYVDEAQDNLLIDALCIYSPLLLDIF